MRSITRAAILGGLLSISVSWAGPAGAADAVPAASIWRVSGPEVSLRFAFPRQYVRLLGQPGKPLPATEAVARQVLAQSLVEQDHRPCPAVDLGYDLGRIEPLYLGPELMGFEMLFHCPHAQGALVLREQALSNRGVPQLALAALYVGAAPAVTRLVTGERGVEIAPGDTSRQPTAGSSALAYAWLGLRGLPGRGLHVLALGGLLLAVRRRGELAGLAAGLGAGYLAAAVASAAGGWVLARGPEAAFDGALVLLTAALLMGRTTGELKKPAWGLAAVAGMGAALALLRGQTSIALALAGAGLSGFSLLWLESLPGVCAARFSLAGVALGGVDGFALPLAAAPLHALVPLPAAGALGYNTGAALAALTLMALLTALRRGWQARAAPAGSTGSFKAFGGYWAYLPETADLLAAALSLAGTFQALTV